VSDLPPATGPRFSIVAYLRLLRLPNVFTAAADIMLGYVFTHHTLQPALLFSLLLPGSILLYFAGMVLNDYFDRAVDAQERANRPIPSGQIGERTAAWLGCTMLGSGIFFGLAAAYFAADIRPAAVATLLALAVLLYDGALKRTMIAPALMGACRFLNVLLGMSTSEQAWELSDWMVALGIGTYITGVTMLARTEARLSSRARLASSTLVMMGGLVFLARYPWWASEEQLVGWEVPERWGLFWVMIGLLISWRCVRAIVDPRPTTVQSAVKNAIFSLIILDAGAVLPAGGLYWSIAILLLLVPGVVLGNWLYST
jgi:4-hydroxybenzoate polyprenyltransferase